MEALNIFSLLVSICSGIGGALITAVSISIGLSRKIERMHDEVKGQIQRSNEVNTELTQALRDLSDTCLKIMNTNDTMVERLNGARGQIRNEIIIAKGEIINEIKDQRR